MTDVINLYILCIQVSVSKSADGSVSSELSLQVVEWKDEGTYTCLAREISSAAEGAKPTKQEIMLEIYGKIDVNFIKIFLKHIL